MGWNRNLLVKGKQDTLVQCQNEQRALKQYLKRKSSEMWVKFYAQKC